MQIANPQYAGAAGVQFSPDEPVEVDDAVAAELLAIQDGGFYAVDTGAAKKKTAAKGKTKAEVDPKESVSEVDPDAVDTGAAK
jgi:hypothetical protein